MENKNNTGVLFRNDKKVEGSNQPDYTGYTIIENERKRLAAWIRESKAGQKYMSIQISEFNEQGNQTQQSQSQAQADDDLPF